MRNPMVSLVVLGTMLFLSACSADEGPPQLPTGSQQKESSGLQTIKLSDQQMGQIAITTVPVKKVQLPELIDLTGQVEEDPTMTTPVISLVPGRIIKVNVQLGDEVQAGDILAEVRSDEVAQIESDLLKDVLEVDAQISETQVDLELAKATFDRQTLLFGEGIAARSEVERAKGEYQKAQVELRSLQTKKDASISATTERMKLYGVHPHEIQRLLSSRTVDNTFDVVAPRNGVIVDRQVDIAQLIGSEDHLFVVSDLSRVWVVAQLFQRDISKVKKGLPVSMIVEGYADKEFKGKVDYISAAIDSTNRTLPVRCTVMNPDLLLKPKMFGRMVVECGSCNVLAVPADAVQRTGETNLVYVAESNRVFKERQVEVGKKVGNYIEVLSGVHDGDRVAVKGSLQLRGMAIQQVARSEEVED